MFSVVFNWSRVVVVQVFCLASCPFPAEFSSGFLKSVPIGISRLGSKA